MIRINDLKFNATLKAAVIVGGLLLCAVMGFGQQTINLSAAPTTVTLPDGTVVPMWGYFCGSAVTTATATCAALNPYSVGNATAVPPVPPTWSPVVITVPYASTGTSLTINLSNNLLVPAAYANGRHCASCQHNSDVHRDCRTGGRRPWSLGAADHHGEPQPRRRAGVPHLVYRCQSSGHTLHRVEPGGFRSAARPGAARAVVQHGGGGSRGLHGRARDNVYKPFYSADVVCAPSRHLPAGVGHASFYSGADGPDWRAGSYHRAIRYYSRHSVSGGRHGSRRCRTMQNSRWNLVRSTRCKQGCQHGRQHGEFQRDEGVGWPHRSLRQSQFGCGGCEHLLSASSELHAFLLPH